MRPEQEAPAPIPDEQAADFARLQAMAGEESPQAPGQAVAEATPPPNPAEGLAALLTLAAGVFHMSGFKRAAANWTPEVCREFADKATPVLQKYAWGQRILAFIESGLGVEEVALITFAAPVVAATVAAARLDIADAKKREPIDSTAATVAETAPAAPDAGQVEADPFHQAAP